jgi:hypothetical protein
MPSRWPSSGDSVKVAAATYTENLSIAFSLKLIGADAKTTIIDGGHNGSVVMISNSGSRVTLSKLTIQNGFAIISGGGIYNAGTLTINNTTISGNTALSGEGGDGIDNEGTLTINNSTVSRNRSDRGGGIYNGRGTATLQNSIVANNDSGGLRRNNDLKWLQPEQRQHVQL